MDGDTDRTPGSPEHTPAQVGIHLTAVAQTRVMAGGTSSRCDRPSGVALLEYLESSLISAVNPRTVGSSHLTVDLGSLIDDVLDSPDERLGRVTVLRISPFEQAITQPFQGWPERLRRLVDGSWAHGKGGTDIYGTTHDDVTVADLDRTLALAEVHDSDVICIAATGAMMDPTLELRAAEYLLSRAPERRIVMSHETPGRRFVERENSTILNACLLQFADAVTSVLQSASKQTGASIGVVAADGTRKTTEEARSSPVALVDAGASSIALGAAVHAGAESALVLVWHPDGVRLMALERGVLRCGHLRRARALDGLPITQRHVNQPLLIGEVTDYVTPDLVDQFQVILINGAGGTYDDGGVSEQFAVFAESLRQKLSCLVVVAPPDHLSALGASAALALYEVERFVIAENEGRIEVERALTQRLVQSRAQTAARGPSITEVISDVSQPLAFLTAGPTLIRSVIVARETEGS